MDDYTGPITPIPSFVIYMKLVDQSKPQSLVQRVDFEGLEPPQPFITLIREPKQRGTYTHIHDHVHTFTFADIAGLSFRIRS